MTLDKADLQKFWKRLRKTQKSKIKYYAVGEYGEKKKRPHYHAIVFNIENVNQLADVWQKGDVHVGTVSGDSIGYTAGYVNKGKIIPQFKGDDRIKEFSVMSKGLGKNYLTDQIIKYHKKDIERNYVTLDGNVRVALPRYYRDRIYSDFEKKQQRNIIVNSKYRKDNDLLNEHIKKYGQTDMDVPLLLESKAYARKIKFDSQNKIIQRKDL